MDWLDGLTHWHWWIAGVALVVLEVFVSGAFLIWLGVGALVTGALLYVVPGMAWEWQVTIFSALSVISIFAWRYYRNEHPEESDHPNLNMRGASYIGRTFTLDQPIENGSGKVKVDDSTWKVRGPDLPAGTQVKVTSVDGVVFVVEALEA